MNASQRFHKHSLTVCYDVWQGKEKKKVEIESYTPPVIALEHEESVFFAEPFAKRGEFESRYIIFIDVMCLYHFCCQYLGRIAVVFSWKTIAVLMNRF